MKKQQITSISLGKYFQGLFQYISFSENSVVSRKEIENHMVKNNICGSRLVTDILEAMVSNGHLVKEKLNGQKRMGYAVNEEIISSMNESYVTSGVKKNGLPIYDKITQRELNKEIKDMIRRYKKLIGNKKSDVHNDLTLFFLLHTKLLTVCLSWISRLTISIRGGLFLDKENKIFLARKNIELLESFIDIICWNTKEKNPDNYDLFLTSMHNFFEYLDPFAGSPYSEQTKELSSLMH